MRRFAFAFLFALACSAEPDPGLSPEPTVDASRPDSGSGGSPAVDAAADVVVIQPDATKPPDAPVCASETFAGEQVPLALLVLLDRSGSMRGTKFSAAQKALVVFADRGDVVGMKLGLQVFPTVKPLDQCNANVFREPLVPLAPLPGNVLPIRDALISLVADGSNTPMRSALEGSIAALRDELARDPQQQGAVILVTDGEPAGCGDLSTVVNAAKNGAAPPGGAAKILTFVIGMAGAKFANLNQIAAAGLGAPTAFDISSSSDSAQALVDALVSIRSRVFGCEFVLKEPTAHGVLDLESVEVRFTPGENDPTKSFRPVASQQDCGETTGGFYYDDPKAPTRAILCEASCEELRSAGDNAKVEVSFGCIWIPR
jgi:hypothetical protein